MSGGDVLSRELEREARRALRLLLERGGCLKRTLRAAPARQNVWHMCSSDGTRKRGIAAFDDDCVGHMLDQGWLDDGADNRAMASEPGRRWFEAHVEAAPSKRPARATPARQSSDVVLQRPGLNLAESPLVWLGQRRDRDGRPILSEVQVAAGERLRSDFEKAGLRPAITLNWDMAATKPAGRKRSAYVETAPGGKALDARRRFHAAVDAVGPELSGVLVDTCCFLHGLESVEAQRDWPRRSAKLVLQLALTRLARHYGLERPACVAEGRI